MSCIRVLTSLVHKDNKFKGVFLLEEYLWLIHVHIHLEAKIFCLNRDVIKYSFGIDLIHI